MASILTPEDVVRRIAAECTFIDERGAVGIRLKPAAAIVRHCREQFRQPAPAKANPPAQAAAVAVIRLARGERAGHTQSATPSARRNGRRDALRGRRGLGGILAIERGGHKPP